MTRKEIIKNVVLDMTIREFISDDFDKLFFRKAHEAIEKEGLCDHQSGPMSKKSVYPEPLYACTKCGNIVSPVQHEIDIIPTYKTTRWFVWLEETKER